MKNLMLLVGLIAMLGIFACTPTFQPIDYGKDGCVHCKMTIMDKKFAAEFVDKKGKAFKFDDIICMKAYVAEKSLNDKDLLLFVANYKHADSAFINVSEAVLLKAEQFKSPMSGNLAAFTHEAAAKEMQTETNAETKSWSTIE